MALRQYTIDLLNATRERKWEEVKQIFKAQPQLVNEKFDGVTSLWWIVRDEAPEDLLLDILDFTEEDVVDYVSETGQSILHFLAGDGRVQALRRALEISHRRVNWKNTFGGSTPLHCLLRSNHSYSIHSEATQVLMNVGADSNIKNQDGLTPTDVYIQNTCERYNYTNKKELKEELLHILRSVVVPGVILARGQEALKAYKEELETGQITVNHARLMMAGKGGVGKTCLVNTLLNKPFNEEEPETDGIVLTTAFQTTSNNCTDWNEEENMDESKRIKQIYDNALECNVAEKLKRKGSQSNSEATPAKKAHLSVHQTAPTFAPVKQQNFVMEQSGTLQREHVADKKDTSEATSSGQTPLSEMQKRLVDRIIGRTSEVVTNEDLTYIWDFAGQQLYYITHRVFLTIEAVYLILFNLTESMHAKGKCRVSKMAKEEMTYNMTNIQIIKYWMRLIFMYAVSVDSEQKQQHKVKKPQIVVVGTHYDSLPGTEEDKMKQVKEQFGIIFQEIKGTAYECHVLRKIYAIDNKSASPSEMLKMLKQDVGEFLKVMRRPIPLKWLEFQSLLQEIGRTALSMPHAEVCKVATECGISAKNLIHTLNYLHDLGIILYFENNELLKHTVITNPRKLIVIFKKIITVVAPDDNDKWSSMIKLWNKLDDEGILEEDLARHLWRNELSEDENLFEVFLELMTQFGLLCEQIKEQESTQRSFFVPCRLKHSEDGMAVVPDTDQMVSIYMASDDFLPDSIFHQLVVSFIGMVQDMGYRVTPELFSNKANIAIGDDHNLSLGQVVIGNKPSLKLEILRVPELHEDGTEMPTGEPSPRVCMQVLEFLKEKLKVLTSSMRHTSYEINVLCWRTGLQETHFHKLEDCLMKKSIRCKKKSLKTSKLQRVFKNMTDSIVQGASTQMSSDLGYLDDKHLLTISRDLGPEWKQLGVRLGLSWKKVKQICYSSKQLSENTMEMLTEWRKRQNYKKNQVAIMASALKEQGLTELANKVFGSQVLSGEPDTVDQQDGKETHQEYDGCMVDTDLQFVAERLDSDWETFGIYLGMKRSEIKHIKSDFSPPMVDASLEMLVKWREKQEAKVNHLVKMTDALDNLERGNIIAELHTYYREKYNKC